MELTGLHHVTAVSGRAADNLAFYTQVLGLRLVKRTVNQDDVSAYHLFYADELGSPGTDMTFFDWPNAGPDVHGTGSVSATAFRVPSAQLPWWQERLDSFGVQHSGIQERDSRQVLAFTDTEGQRLELRSDDDAVIEGGTPWPESPVPAEAFIRGLHTSTLVVADLAPTARFLTEILGFRQTREYATPSTDSRQIVVFETGPGGPGAEVHVDVQPRAPRARVGIGGVHHIAFRVPDDETHQQWQQRLAQAGVGVTPVIDRFYFRSLYFREPGGVLFEIATDGPGFATDEDKAHLGENLALPPFLEPHREQIERGLKPIGHVQLTPR